MASALTSKNSGCSAELTAESRRHLEKLAKADLMKDLRAQMMAATQPLAPAVKSVARQKIHAPGTRRNKTSLSSQVANAVQRSVVASSRTISVTVAMICKGNLSNLARAVEGEIPWVHPTFGHEPQVTQRPRPFFYHTLETMMPKVTQQIESVFSKLEKRL